MLLFHMNYADFKEETVLTSLVLYKAVTREGKKNKFL